MSLEPKRAVEGLYPVKFVQAAKDLLQYENVSSASFEVLGAEKVWAMVGTPEQIARMVVMARAEAAKDLEDDAKPPVEEPNTSSQVDPVMALPSNNRALTLEEEVTILSAASWLITKSGTIWARTFGNQDMMLTYARQLRAIYEDRKAPTTLEMLAPNRPATSTDSVMALNDYQPGQWWLQSLEDLWGHGKMDNDAKRAAKIACNFAASVFAAREKPAPAAQQAATPQESQDELVRRIHKAVLAINCNPDVDPAKRFAFISGIHMAAARIAAFANTSSEVPHLFTCEGKGGEYEVIAHGLAAGELADILTPQEYTIYRDTQTGMVFVRLTVDFLSRMVLTHGDAPVNPPAMREQTFQRRVKPWMLQTFGRDISADITERCDRFTEESIELVQSLSMPKDRVLQLVDYVYSRPAGEPEQEVGGVMVTLAALCLATPDLEMNECAEIELARIWAMVDQIREKQKSKPRGSALPVPVEKGLTFTLNGQKVKTTRPTLFYHELRDMAHCADATPLIRYTYLPKGGLAPSLSMKPGECINVRHDLVVTVEHDPVEQLGIAELKPNQPLINFNLNGKLHEWVGTNATFAQLCAATGFNPDDVNTCIQWNGGFRTTQVPMSRSQELFVHANLFVRVFDSTKENHPVVFTLNSLGYKWPKNTITHDELIKAAGFENNPGALYVHYRLIGANFNNGWKTVRPGTELALSEYTDVVVGVVESEDSPVWPWPTESKPD
jgi:hypothetical protein